MSRTLSCVVFAWAVAAPLLCSGGVLQHACPEETPSTCGHEEDCEADPCLDASAPGGASGARAPIVLALAGGSFPVSPLPPAPSVSPAGYAGGAPPPESFRSGTRPLLL
ncbi:MAG: hypothetical protein ACT4PE_01330 [Candidatus Eiseniibacteriota bacterium]